MVAKYVLIIGLLKGIEASADEGGSMKLLRLLCICFCVVQRRTWNAKWG